MKPEIVDLIKWLGGVAIGVFGLLKAYQSYLDAEKVKAKENSVGAEKVKEIEHEMKELKTDFRDVVRTVLERK